MYDGLERVFRLRGSCTAFWRASNGILQGCALSMIGLNAIVGVLPEIIAESVVPEVILRGRMRMMFRGWLKLQRDSSCKIVFDASTCWSRPMKMLMGGSFPSPKPLPLATKVYAVLFMKNTIIAKLKRFKKWHGTICRLRHAPIPWKNKAKMLLATQTQALRGQGTL